MTLFDTKDVNSLRRVTFLIAVELDSEQRLTNLIEQLKYLRAIGSPVFLYESSKTQQLPSLVDLTGINYRFFECNLLHRTKLFNIMATDTDADVMVLHDVDVFLPISQLIDAVTSIENGTDFCYPYVHWKATKSIANLDVPTITDESVGGSVLCKRSSFFAAGMENEYFKSWGIEDLERFTRWQILGYIVRRVDGSLYHMEHWRDDRYNEPNEPWQRNLDEYKKVKAMTKDELLRYIKTWPWCNLRASRGLL